MSDEEIIEMCREAALLFPMQYTVGEWVPHQWVIEVVRRAYFEGRDEG